jgi:hypothetical protein
MVKYICRDLFQIIKNAELKGREKMSPTIDIDIEEIGNHISTCPICRNQIESITAKFISNPLQFLKLMKG